MKKVVLITVLAVALGGCATYTKLAQEADSVIGQAEMEMKLASKMNYLWRDTESILKSAKDASAEAKKADAAGDGAKAKALTMEAKQLATTALTQAKLAQQQAKDNASAGPSYPNM